MSKQPPLTRLVLLLLTASLLTASSHAGTDAVFVSAAKDSVIVVFQQADDGTLTRAGSTDPADADVKAPGSLAKHPTKNILYAALRGSGKLGAFAINPATLELNALGAIDAGSAAYVLPDANGKFLASAYYRDGKVMVHRIQEDGSLDPKPVVERKTDEKAHAVRFSPDHSQLYVPHTGPNTIFQFGFDAKTGTLTALDPLRAVVPEETFPRHLWFHPTRTHAFSSNEKSSGISSYRFDPTTGLVSHQQRLSTLPTGYTNRNSTADIEVHPKGSFVYVSNRGHDSIAGFAIADDGTLTSLGQTPTEKTPRSFNISPDGQFLYAAGQGSGALAAFRIGQVTGALRRFATYDDLAGASWVQCVRLE